jgi:hypothetical protein
VSHDLDSLLDKKKLVLVVVLVVVVNIRTKFTAVQMTAMQTTKNIYLKLSKTVVLYKTYEEKCNMTKKLLRISLMNRALTHDRV